MVALFIVGACVREFFAHRGDCFREGVVEVCSEPMTVAVRYLVGADWQLRAKLGSVYTHWSYNAKTDFALESDPSVRPPRYGFKVVGARVKLSLPVSVWLPVGVSSSSQEHEAAHRVICQKIYQTAPQLAAALAKGCLGESLSIDADNEKGARSAAQSRLYAKFAVPYEKATEDKASKINKLYDDITAHGANLVSSQDGIARAFAAYEKKTP